MSDILEATLNQKDVLIVIGRLDGKLDAVLRDISIMREDFKSHLVSNLTDFKIMDQRLKDLEKGENRRECEQAALRHMADNGWALPCAILPGAM